MDMFNRFGAVIYDDNLYIICLRFKHMIDKALAGLNPVQNQNQSYYFQLYPLSLTIVGEQSSVPAPGTTYRFIIFKGQQKFDETKLPIEANYKNINGVNLMVMPKCPINFYTPTFNKNRKTEFQFQMYQYEENNEYFIADYIIDIEPYISQYKNSRTVRFQHKSKFSEDYQLEFEIYIEKSRFGLEKVVKDYKHERSLKSPLRQRKESSPSKRNSPSKKNLTTESPEKREPELSSQSSKIQREEATEISQSRNRKFEESQKSLKDDSKKVSARSSRVNNSEVQPTREVQPISRKTTKAFSSTIQPEFEEKKQESKIKQKIVKNYSEREKSESSSINKVPIIATKFKPLAKQDTPAQIKMTQSQRLGTIQTNEKTESVLSPKKQKEDIKQKILMILFLLVSLFLMYKSMHPNRKV